MYKKFIWWTLTFIIAAIIFWFSSQPDYKSNDLSMKITEKIAEIVPGEKDVTKMNKHTRNYAHLIMYLLLGISAFMSLKQVWINKKIWTLFFYTTVFCLLYAISDEIHQIFVPGRGFQVSDIIIDICGSLLGSMCVIAAFWIYNFIKTKKYRVIKVRIFG